MVLARMKSSEFLNPVTEAIELIDEYRAHIREALLRGQLPEDQVDEVMEHLQVTSGPGSVPFDRHVWFTLRSPFAASELTLDQLGTDLGIHDETIQAFEGRLHHPYRHQEQAIRSILAGVSTVIASGTGSGKTEAFLLPVIELSIPQNLVHPECEC